MELYKSRGFGEFFQDTFAFLKQSGKHLFKQFFIVNGIFLIILMVLGYFFSKFYTDVVFGGLMSNNPSVVDDYMNENMGIFIVLIILFCTVGLIAGVVSYSFVPIYLKLYSERGGSNFETRDIVDLYKKHIGKIFIFLVCAILVSIPLMIVCGVAMFLLVITIIGMLLLPLVIGFVALFYQSTLIEYIEDKKGIWECFGYAWTLISSKFWAAIGSVGIFFLMSYIVQNIIALIPYIFGMASLFTTIEQGDSMNNPQEIAGTMTVMMIAVFLLTFLVSSILNVIVQLNQGIVFYSLKEDNENINTKSVIDQIGSGE